MRGEPESLLSRFAQAHHDPDSNMDVLYQTGTAFDNFRVLNGGNDK